MADYILLQNHEDQTVANYVGFDPQFFDTDEEAIKYFDNQFTNKGDLKVAKIVAISKCSLEIVKE